MTPPETIRIFRYHMTSSHVIQEQVAEDLAVLPDDELLARAGRILEEGSFILVTDVVSESRVMLRTDRIEMIQVGHAHLVVSAEQLHAAEVAEETAIERAMRRMREEGR